VKSLSAAHATSIADLRKKTTAEIMATPGDPGSSVRPIMDGYVLPDMLPAVFGRRQQNDVPLLAGSNADEGSMIPAPHTLAAFRKYGSEGTGPLADEFFKLYEADNDVEAHKAGQLAMRDTLFAWPTLQWVKAQARTGTSKVFYYHFSHNPPIPPDHQFTEHLGKDFGVYHGAELAYVFGNFVPQDWAWTDADRALAKAVQQYWVNFATSGDPNGPGLPAWPAFNPGTASVQYLDTTIGCV
jgi:para-nitrobenzyl esterase